MSEASPRFRQDLVASATEADGVPCVDVSDPQTGTNFRLYDFEYQLALQLNGQPLAAVTTWATETYGVDLTTEGVTEFAGRLGELGFLEAAQPPAAAPVSIPAAVTGPAPLPTPAAVTAPSPVPTPAAVTAPSPVPTPAAVTAPDPADNPEAEWNTTEGAQTAQFVPDPALFGPAELTPVAPQLETLAAEAAEAAEATSKVSLSNHANPPAAAPAPPAPVMPPPPAAPSQAAPSQAAPSQAAPSQAAPSQAAPSQAAPSIVRSVAMSRPAEAPTVPAIPSRVLAGMKPGAGKNWAAEIDGLDGRPAATKPAGSTPPLPGAPPALPVRTGAAPAGVDERRQPPPPESVVMSGFAEDRAAAAAAAAPKKSSRAIGIALLLVLAGVIGYFVWRNQKVASIQPVGVRVLAPRPAAVYRWFSGPGEVTDCETRTIGFDTTGRLTELLPPGTVVTAGELLGKLQGAAQIETLLAHNRSRVAFYKQVQESMRAAGNQPELRQAELRLAEKRRLLDETQVALARLTLRASEPGELVETLAKVGTMVSARTPIARVKGRALHGSFAMDAEDGAVASGMDFCRVEVVGLGPHASNREPRRSDDVATDSRSPEAQNGPRFVDCTYTKAAAGKVKVILPGDVGLVPGQPLRLARRRFDGVFPVPAGAITGAGSETAVWLATAAGTAERRPVVVAEHDGEALISAGLHAGDKVILDPPAGLSPGAPLALLP